MGALGPSRRRVLLGSLALGPRNGGRLLEVAAVVQERKRCRRRRVGRRGRDSWLSKVKRGQPAGRPRQFPARGTDRVVVNAAAMCRLLVSAVDWSVAGAPNARSRRRIPSRGSDALACGRVGPLRGRLGRSLAPAFATGGGARCRLCDSSCGIAPTRREQCSELAALPRSAHCGAGCSGRDRSPAARAAGCKRMLAATNSAPGRVGEARRSPGQDIRSRTTAVLGSGAPRPPGRRGALARFIGRADCSSSRGRSLLRRLTPANIPTRLPTPGASGHFRRRAAWINAPRVASLRRKAQVCRVLCQFKISAAVWLCDTAAATPLRDGRELKRRLTGQRLRGPLCGENLRG